jgi:drug/metabolite transporter (DMT)-like permease
MSLVAVALVLFAAVLHAGWNALAKRRADVLAFYWALTVAALGLYAIPFVVLIRRHPPSWEGVPFLVASSLAEVAYGVFLARAYARSDLSFAYPIARGTGVLLVPLMALPLFGEHPSLLAWLGIALIVLGVLWLHLPVLRRMMARQGLDGVVSPPAVLTGVTIATYSLIDSAGVRRVHPFVYLYLTYVLIAIWLAPFILTRRRPALAVELRQGWPMLVGGMAVFGTYCIILVAFRLAPVSYVVPMREISIVVGAVIGVRLLGEPFGRSRVAACVVVATGVIAIGVGG